ncbi:hypothetical protein BpHYR1_003403 [Brachionus plicatilis]|uniref:Uncharacterized protein n=1 Tax=Brachionus plicatilis TaxID=10195 RepID=A0A3M7R1V7_BRAPC|nr:hypothetical protein BpHYR1_003403 [Brachionus plicatilis]
MLAIENLILIILYYNQLSFDHLIKCCRRIKSVMNNQKFELYHSYFLEHSIPPQIICCLLLLFKQQINIPGIEESKVKYWKKFFDKESLTKKIPNTGSSTLILSLVQVQNYFMSGDLYNFSRLRQDLSFYRTIN